MKIFGLILTLILVSPPGFASWVRIDGDTPWKARAIQGAVVQYLTGFERLAAEDMPPLDCEDLDCIMQNAKPKNVQVVFIGNLTEKEFSLKAYSPKTKRLISQFNFHLNKKADLNELKHQIFILIKPFIDIGGILDQEEIQNQIPQGYSLKIAFLFLGIGSALALIFLGKLFSKNNKQIKKKLKFESKPIKMATMTIAMIFIGFILIQSFRYHSIYKERQDKIKLQEQKNGRK